MWKTKNNYREAKGEFYEVGDFKISQLRPISR
jgi:hypothetical protein